MQYQKLSCIMSQKIHFLHSHLDFFSDNCGMVSDEHVKRFCKYIVTMEQRYNEKWPTTMLDYYSWKFQRCSQTAVQETGKEI